MLVMCRRLRATVLMDGEKQRLLRAFACPIVEATESIHWFENFPFNP